jgi:DNA-directed RNA polymerase specialized sigma subunit
MTSFTCEHSVDERWLRATEEGKLPEVATHDSRLAAILALPDFERFVYVLSILEGCTDRECGALLGVSPQEIEETRLHALQHFWKRWVSADSGCEASWRPGSTKSRIRGRFSE